MRYYLIAGEPSGDLHASHLMRALQAEDPGAEFRFYGGDLMAAVGGQLVVHYRHLAYMGILPVLLHLPTIMTNLRRCRRDVEAWRPDVLILIDYPGFNLRIARAVHRCTSIPVYYYISPKVWAWREHRVRSIRSNVDALFSILPFEVDFFERKHHYPIHYVGNPTMDEVVAFRRSYQETFAAFTRRCGLPDRPIIALLAGSRRQEIAANLPRMLKAVATFPQMQAVIAAAPGLPTSVYEPYLQMNASRDGEGGASHADGPARVSIVRGETYPLLAHSRVALVTSGTATLETALLRVPQVVCYYVSAGKLVSFLRRLILKVDYISLVNLVAGREVVPELVADGMTVDHIRSHLTRLLPDGTDRQRMLLGYDEVALHLGEEGAPSRAARQMVNLLSQH